MKKYTIRKANRIGIITKTDKKGVVCHGSEHMEVSDGYHTMDELYVHRITLYIALCKSIHWQDCELGCATTVWRSRLHSDGSAFEGWFILGIEKEKGKQITYHIPMSYWQDTEFAEILDKAPEWDGHTSADVLERLMKL